MAELPGPVEASAEREALDRLPVGVVAFDDEGRVVSANAALLALLGRARGEVEGRPVEALLTVAGRLFFQTHLYPLTRLHGRVDELFVLFRRQDGGEVGALVSATRRPGGRITDCAVMEVRERRKFEDALLRAKREAEAARATLEARTRELEEANERLEQQALELELQQQQLEEQAAELEMQSDELQSLNDALIDRGAQLDAARIAAEEANRAKSLFLATMSHELRTPLNAIGGYVQLLELGIHGPLADAQRDVLARVARAQRHLLRLINDVLNLARIEAGRVEYAIEPLPVHELVAGVTSMVEPQAQTARLAIAVEVASDATARADRDKAQQILLNLLGNAVKFTPAGGRIVVRGAPAEGGRVRLDVSDTGVGIPRDKLQSVFEPFVQVSDSRERRREGTGLGLAISRDLARGMGGDLSVESEPGRGTTFTLTLPAA